MGLLKNPTQRCCGVLRHGINMLGNASSGSRSCQGKPGARLSWLPDAVPDRYCADGRPGIDPEVAVRLMLAALLLGFVHDRRLMREAQVNLAIRWFIGYGPDERLPDHSSLTWIRQPWGAARFRRIFERMVLACVEAGI
jgi:Transposase domain (DUF772)